MPNTDMIAPAFGAIFVHEGRRYRVKGFMKPATPPQDPDSLEAILFETAREFTEDQVRLERCPRNEAVYVSGAGVAGCIVKITDIEVVGMVPWDPEFLAQQEQSSRRLWGQVLA